jgi:hypothetical protein
MAKDLERMCKDGEIQASNVRICSFLSTMQEKIETIDSMDKRLTRVEERLTRVEEGLGRLLAHFGPSSLLRCCD